MRWCCMGFKAHTEIAGERGFGIFSDPTTPPSRIVLQCRAADSAVDSAQVSAPYPISVVSEIVIQYCPFCGKHLESWYGDKLRRIARPDLAVKLRFD